MGWPRDRTARAGTTRHWKLPSLNASPAQTDLDAQKLHSASGVRLMRLLPVHGQFQIHHHTARQKHLNQFPNAAVRHAATNRRDDQAMIQRECPDAFRRRRVSGSKRDGPAEAGKSGVIVVFSSRLLPAFKGRDLLTTTGSSATSHPIDGRLSCLLLPRYSHRSFRLWGS